MAIINKKLIKYDSQAQFNKDLLPTGKNTIANSSIVFIQDTGRIYAHGKYFGGAWEDISNKPTTFTPSAHTLGSHSDVTLATLANGNILRYNGSRWVNNTLAQAGIATPADISTAIDGIEIGGRNLALNTSAKWEPISWGGWYWNSSFINYTEAKPNEIYTISIHLKNVQDSLGGALRLWVRWFDENGINVGSENNGSLIYDEGVSKATFIIPEGIYGFRALIRGTQLDSTKSCEYRMFKAEKENKATDWTPAPEDQVSDWLTTDVNSFSYIKNKPTKLTLTGAVTGNTTLNSGELSLNTSLTEHTHT